MLSRFSAFAKPLLQAVSSKPPFKPPWLADMAASSGIADSSKEDFKGQGGKVEGTAAAFSVCWEMETATTRLQATNFGDGKTRKSGV